MVFFVAKLSLFPASCCKLLVINGWTASASSSRTSILPDPLRAEHADNAPDDEGHSPRLLDQGHEEHGADENQTDVEIREGPLDEMPYGNLFVGSILSGFLIAVIAKKNFVHANGDEIGRAHV